MTRKIQALMIGCGNMGGGLLTRWLDQDEYEFTVVSPSGREMPDGVAVVTSAEALTGKHFDLIIIAVKPQMIPDVLPAYTRLIAGDGCFLSIAAGYSTTSLETLVGGMPLIRIMPNLPVQIGQGVSALYNNQHATARHHQIVSKLMATTGKLIPVATEDHLDRLTAIAGSGPGYAFEIARCWIRAGESLGFSEADASTMVLQTIAGSIELALRSEVSLGALRDGVTSKNGTTAAGLAALNKDASLDRLLRQTVEAAYARAIELR